MPGRDGLLQVPSVLSHGHRVSTYLGALRSILALPLGFYAACRHLDLSANEIQALLQPGSSRPCPTWSTSTLAHNRLAVGTNAEYWGTGPRAPDVPGPVEGTACTRPGGAAAGRRLPCTHSLAENSLTRLGRRTTAGTPGWTAGPSQQRADGHARRRL